MESREIYDMLLRAIGEHVDTKGRAAVSINGRPALIVTINRETGEVTARNAITDTTAADAVIDYLNTVAGTKYQKTPKIVAISTPALRRGTRRRTAAG